MQTLHDGASFLLFMNEEIPQNLRRTLFFHITIKILEGFPWMILTLSTSIFKVVDKFCTHHGIIFSILQHYVLVRDLIAMLRQELPHQMDL